MELASSLIKLHWKKLLEDLLRQLIQVLHCTGITLENDLLSEVISKSNDWIWLFERYQRVQLSSSQTVPGWSGFYSKTIDNNFEMHRVSFLPAINQSPTELGTVHEVLQQVKRKT